MAAAFVAVAALLAVSGGFRTTVGGLRISARSPLPILFLALINLSFWYSQARRATAVGSDLESAWQSLQRSPKAIVAVGLMSLMMAGAFATRSAAGADASGYISEAASFVSGHLFYADPLAEIARGHDPFMTSPLGWRPSSSPGLQSPTYPPGLPMLMALPHAIAGANGAAVLVIGTAAVAVIATGLLASHLAGYAAGLIAAALLAFAPIFLFQSIQPMSDVPVTAAWMLCFLLMAKNRDAWAGVACAAAVLIRPNLAPLAIIPLIVANRRIAFATPVAIAGATLAMLQWSWYGSPIRSGYGSAEELFALSNVAANTSRYVRWLVTTAPLFLLFVLGIGSAKGHRLAQGMLAFAALVVGSYLVYAVFDDWSYLRFLLPALAVLAVFASVGLIAIVGRASAAVRAPMVLAIVLIIAAHGVWMARSNDTFRLATQLARVAVVGDYIRDNLEANAVLVAGEQSGSMRYYTGRPILRWEAATPESLTAAAATLQQSGRPIYIVLDAWENEPFRIRYATMPAVALDWPPVLEAGTSHRTRVWRLSDRARYQQGEALDIIRR